MGNISYSVYLLHIFVIMGFEKFVVSLKTFSASALAVTLLGVFPVLIAVSYLSYLLIEKKLGAFLRRRLRI